MNNLNEALQSVNNLIETTLRSSPKQFAPIMEHLLASQGQGVRTQLLLSSAMDKNGLIHSNAINAAASIELFHLATLVHDDIIDEAHTRRGLPSIQSKFGKKHAVICGDYLFGLSLSTLADMYEPYTKFSKKFLRSTQLICLGELNQLSNANNLDLTFFSYLRTINGKTAALFHMATYGGGLVNQTHNGLPEDTVRYLGKFGTYFGIIFQILDDCKDYAQDVATAKKTTHTDIANGVVNLPLIMAMLKEPHLRDSIDIALQANEYIKIVDLVNQHGLDDTIDIVKKYMAKAEVILNKLEPNMATSLKKIMDTQLDKFIDILERGN